MDLTILFTDYLPANQTKQLKPPTLKATQLKPHNNNSDNSDSNAAEVEMDEDIDLEEVTEDVTDHSLKASLQKFFVNLNFCQIYSLSYNLLIN